MKIGFITDPIDGFNPQAETTSFLIQAFQKKKADSFVIPLESLRLEDGKVKAHAQKVKIKKGKQGFSFEIVSQKNLDLNTLDALFLRKDPPFNTTYFDHLSILEILDETGPLMINDPTGIKLAPEKILPLRFPELCPPTLVSSDSEKLLAFLKKHKKVVVKPLNEAGGRGIVMLDSQCPSPKALLDVLHKNGLSYVCMQAFVPEAKKGDKRILLWNGEILGAFLRVPGKKDFRGNLHSGATMKTTKVSAYEKNVVETLAPFLTELGLHFVGLDFLGPWLTEINVTSPMGIFEINSLYKKKVEDIIARDMIESNSP